MTYVKCAQFNKYAVRLGKKVEKCIKIKEIKKGMGKLTLYMKKKSVYISLKKNKNNQFP